MEETDFPSAATHSYLGDISAMRAHHIDFSSPKQVDIFIFPLLGVVLFPGETLPIFVPERQDIMRTMQTTPILGIINMRALTANLIGPGPVWDVGVVGTIAEMICQTTVNDQLVTKAKGVVRFKTISIRRKESLLYANCQTLIDYKPLRPLSRLCATIPLRLMDELSGYDVMNQVYAKFKLQAMDSSTVLNACSNMYRDVDATAFAFFVSSNLALSDRLRQDLLECDLVLTRLYKLDAYLSLNDCDSIVACSRCGSRLFRQSDVFNVPGAEGFVGAYVNPQGHIHQTVTYKDIAFPWSVITSGFPTTESSWFPGYAWSIAICKICGVHLGWKFCRTSRRIGVNCFWGIVRNAVRERSKMSSIEDQRDNEMKIMKIVSLQDNQAVTAMVHARDSMHGTIETSDDSLDVTNHSFDDLMQFLTGQSSSVTQSPNLRLSGRAAFDLYQSCVNEIVLRVFELQERAGPTVDVLINGWNTIARSMIETAYDDRERLDGEEEEEVVENEEENDEEDFD